MFSTPRRRLFLGHSTSSPQSSSPSSSSSVVGHHHRQFEVGSSTCGHYRTSHHLAIDTDPNTPTLKRFVVKNFELCRRRNVQQISNSISFDDELRGVVLRNSTNNNISSSLSSSSDGSRPHSWISNSVDGNWTLKERRNTPRESLNSDCYSDRSVFPIDSPRWSSSSSSSNKGDSPPCVSSPPPPLLTLTRHEDDICCACVKHTTPPVSSSRPASIMEEDPSEMPPPSVDAQSTIHHATPATIVDRSVSSCSSLSNCTDKSPTDQYKSCPDLIRPCILSAVIQKSESIRSTTAMTRTNDGLLTPEYGTLESIRKKRSSRSSRRKSGRLNSISGGGVKSMKTWTLDDIITWLGKIGMDDVASILIGYDISGGDMENWDDHTLLSYGVVDSSVRLRLIKAVQDLKTQLLADQQPSSPRLIARRCSRTSQHRTSYNANATNLYDVIKRSGHDRLIAIDLPDDVQLSRAFTVARRQDDNVLVVSGCRNPQIPLIVGDIIVEFNGETCLPLAAVDFHLLTSQSTKNNKLVVLRKDDRRSINGANDVKIDANINDDSSSSPSPRSQTTSQSPTINVVDHPSIIDQDIDDDRLVLCVKL